MTSDQHYPKPVEKSMQEFLTKRVTSMTVSVFLTIRLFEPRYDSEPISISKRRNSDLDSMHKEVMNRIDRIIHGPHHMGKSQCVKFPYFYRLETKSKGNRSVLPHIHILMGLDARQHGLLLLNRDKLQRYIYKLCIVMGFDCDFDYQMHDNVGVDYVTKFPMADVMNIHFRNLD